MALPIAAAPIAKMFLDAVGLSIAGLAAKDMVDVANKYIEANPDESIKILSTLVPNIGIGQIFMSKEDKISLEDLDEMTDEEAQDLSKEEKAELMKQAGKSGGKNKRQTMIDISEKLGLSGPGREKQDIEYEVDERYDEGGVEGAPRPQFDYKKFFRKRRADGGSIGIEVLFTEKKPRKNFNVGGSASIQDYADAVSKVSAGTTAQKLQNIGEYATNKLGLTQKHFDTIAAMKSDPKKFGIDKQIDYAKLSGKDLVKGANPALQPFVALGQGLASPIYDYYQALQKYSDKGYQGDFELSKKGIVDFGKNLLRVGEEFAAQKPIQMAAGSTLGGLEAIQEGLSQFGTAAAADTSKLKPLGDKERFRLGLFAANQVDEKTGDRLYDIDKMYDNYTKNFAASGGKGYFSSPDMLSRFKQFYADGGRVGLFMGGPALTGTALDIYNSMKAYGFPDAEIANALRARGLYDTTPTPTAPAMPLQLNITRPNGGGKDENDTGGVKDSRSGLGFSTANFGLGQGINKDAVMDYEADADKIGRTPFGQLSRIGVASLDVIKNLPTPLNLARKGIEFAKQKELEKQRQQEAIARDLARSMQQQNRANRTGGYQSSFGGDRDFMGGRGTASEMGSFKDGGLATMFTRRR